jgi:hypothetical protein
VLVSALQKDGHESLARELSEPAKPMEFFVERMTEKHTQREAFEQMRREMATARRSLRENEPMRWMEAFDNLMYTLNFYAERLSAEDHQRWQTVVMPFLMNLTAALPLSSARVLLALRAAGKLDLVAGKVTSIEPRDGTTTVIVEREDASTAVYRYQLFVECGGQGAVGLEDVPFPSLRRQGSVRVPTTRSQDGSRQSLEGIDVNAAYQIVGSDGTANPRIYDVAFPHTIGVRPYSYGLQACSDTAEILIQGWTREAST